LLEVAPEIDTNPTRFYRGRGVQTPRYRRGFTGGSLRLQTPDIGLQTPRYRRGFTGGSLRLQTPVIGLQIPRYRPPDPVIDEVLQG